MGSSVKRLQRKVNKLERNLLDDVTREVRPAMESMKQTARINLVENRTSGILQDTLTVEGPEGSTPIERIVAGRGVRRLKLVSPTDYSKFVEYGTGVRGVASYPFASFKHRRFKSPSNAPVGAIIDWARNRNFYRGVRPKPPFDSSDPGTRLAIRKAQNIERFGTAAHPFMMPAFLAHQSSIERSGGRGVRRSLRRNM